MSILIVDDEVDLCQLLKAMLKGGGHEVSLAHTLKEGLAQVKTLSPDYIFLDNNLPDGFGLNYIEELKSAHPATTVVFMTAMTYLKYDSLLKGVDYFLDKPISFRSVREILTNAS